MAHNNIAELRLTRNDTLDLAQIFKCILEYLCDNTIDPLAKRGCLGDLGVILNLGYEAVKLQGCTYSELYQKHFSSFLRSACFEKRDNSLTAIPISELTQSLIEMLTIAINCFAKASVDATHPNYRDFAQVLKQLMNSAVVQEAGLGAVSARLVRDFICGIEYTGYDNVIMNE